MVVVLIVLIILALGGMPLFGYSAGWGWYPSGGLGVIALILLILLLLGRL